MCIRDRPCTTPEQNRSVRVLVTGGTGFVGGWTAKAIADAGHSIRFLVRNPARLQTSVAKLGADVSDYVVGDITDRVSVREALRGCQAVVHSAALVATDPRQTHEMLTTNMQGAQNVLGQAVELGLDPILHVSSFTAPVSYTHLDVYKRQATCSGIEAGRCVRSRQIRAQISVPRALQPARMVSDLDLFSQGYSLVNAAMRLASRA